MSHPLHSIASLGRSSLLEHEVYRLFAHAGFDVPRHALWTGAPEGPLPDDVRAAIEALGGGAEVVVKIVSPALLHKSDVGGVAFAPAEVEAVRAAAARVWAEVGRRAPEVTRLGVLVVEKLVPAAAGPAAEALVALKQDPAFGPVIVFGLGGMLTEWYGKLSAGSSTVVLAPGEIRAGLAQAVRERPALALLFRPSRLGPAPLDLEVTARRLEALVALGTDAGDGALIVEELEANPVLLTRDDRWVVVDGKGRLGRQMAVRPPRPVERIAALLAPRSAAVLGASATGSNPGRVILRNLKRAEGIPPGAVRAVHPRADAIDGVPCVPSVEALAPSLGGPVDLAVVAVPADTAAEAVRALARPGVARAILLIPGGFAESGHPERERAIVDALAEARAKAGVNESAEGEKGPKDSKGPNDHHGDPGPVLIGPNCLGVVVRGGYNTFFIPQYKLPFHPAPSGAGHDLAVVSQSGAWLVSLASRLDGVVQPRAVLSIGNQMDLTIADLLDHLATDPSLRVIACYIEGFKPLDGERVVRRVRALTRAGRRVIVYKAGRTEAGAAAARSHTASLAGDFAVAHDLLVAAGALVAADLDELGDAVKAHALLADRLTGTDHIRASDGAGQPNGHGHDGRRVAILSNAGFECSVVADHLGALVPARLSDETRARLAAVLPAMAHADNPIDATPIADTRAFAAAASALAGDPGVDAIILSPLPATPALDNLPPDPFGTHRENLYGAGSLAQALAGVFAATRKPMVACIDSGALYDPLVGALERAGIPTYRRIDRAARALSGLLSTGRPEDT